MSDNEEQPVQETEKRPAGIPPMGMGAHAARPTPATSVAQGRPGAVTEEFLLLVMREPWDDRMEKARIGGWGHAITGALLLDLALHSHMRVQRDQFILEPGASGDADLDAVAEEVRRLSGVRTGEALETLARGMPKLAAPWKQRLVQRGVITERRWRHLGVFARSETRIANPDLQETVRNKLRRALAGSGPVDASGILVLALAEASGLLPDIVPASTLEFNKKRIQGWLTGRDTLDYKVDGSLRRVQPLAVTTILDCVRSARTGR